MWSKTHSIIVAGIEPYQIWKVWSDVNNWPQWHEDIKWTELKGPFEKGTVFHLKPKDGPKVAIEIIECVPNQNFMDCTKFPFARMYGIHKLEKTNEGLHISTTMKIEGLLSWLWRKFVAEKVAAAVPQQTEMLIQLASKIK